ncbi:MAG: hypothetical protein ACYCO3_04455 [Mycobacteriales bacterium]
MGLTDVAVELGENGQQAAATVAASAHRAWSGASRGDLRRLRGAVAQAAGRAFVPPVRRSAARVAERAAPLGSPWRAHSLATAVVLTAGSLQAVGGVAALAEAGAGPAAVLAPATAASSAAVAATAQLAEFYLVCAVIGYELRQGCTSPAPDVVMRALVETYAGAGAGSRIAGERAVRLVAARLGRRVGGSAIPLASITSGGYLIHRDLRRARVAARRGCTQPAP